MENTETTPPSPHSLDYLLNASTHEAHILVRNHAKIYPDHVRFYSYNEKYLQRKKGFQKRSIDTPLNPSPRGSEMTPEQKEESIQTSLRRTKTTVSDLITCNNFTWFGTFTFNGDPKNTEKYGYTVHDRHNDTAIKQTMYDWLQNQQKRHKAIYNHSFSYIVIPERHKDGAIHFHALFGANFKGVMKNSGKFCQVKHNDGKRHNVPVYNVSSFKAGHSDFTRIIDRRKTGLYVTKYLTKEMILQSGKKRYWASRDLKRPTTETNSELHKMPFLPEVEEEYENSRFTKYRLNVTIEKSTKFESLLAQAKERIDVQRQLNQSNSESPTSN